MTTRREDLELGPFNGSCVSDPSSILLLLQQVLPVVTNSVVTSLFSPKGGACRAPSVRQTSCLNFFKSDSLLDSYYGVCDLPYNVSSVLYDS